MAPHTQGFASGAQVHSPYYTVGFMTGSTIALCDRSMHFPDTLISGNLRLVAIHTTRAHTTCGWPGFSPAGNGSTPDKQEQHDDNNR
ncbi:putative uncharacterized protein [Desulfovibrio ferrophilus]|uniref:Uncharacterized protein n=1 Tax=Desulfovibrio ferrophilus TaxID=241368 RepID=A0A2Z6AVC3_9BACT|nr:putative uncharacterized protein [Desulfovibrio ferrophilus]